MSTGGYAINEHCTEVEMKAKVPDSVKFERQLIALIQQFAFSNELKVSSIEISWARNEDHFEGSSIDRIFVDYKSTRKS